MLKPEISNIYSYLNTCGINNSAELNSIKRKVKLSLKSGELNLNNLSISNKIMLISFILRSDGLDIFNILDRECNITQLPHFRSQHSSIIAVHFVSICAHRRDDSPSFVRSGVFINRTMRNIIKSMLMRLTDMAFCMICMEAVRQIPDNFLYCTVKDQIIKEIFSFCNRYRLYAGLSDYSFNSADYQSATHTMYHPATTPRMKLKRSEYNMFMKHKKYMTTLEYIVITNAHFPGLYSTKYAKFRFCLLFGSYDDILKSCGQPSPDHFLWDDPIANETRRYMETKLALIYLHDDNVQYNKLNNFFEYAFRTTPSSVEESISMVLAFTAIAKQDDMLSPSHLKSISKQHALKDNMKKAGIISKTKLGKIGDADMYSGYVRYMVDSEHILSGNIGVLKSYQRIPCVEVSNQAMVNKVADSVAIQKYKEGGFADQYRGAAYTGSLSGHIYGVISQMIKLYRQEIIRDIEEFIILFKLITVSYVTRGYHSFIEIYAVILDPEIQVALKSVIPNLQDSDFSQFDFSLAQLTGSLAETYPVARLNVFNRILRQKVECYHE